MNPLQPTRSDSAIDRVLRYARAEELASRHYPVLRRGEVQDDPLRVGVPTGSRTVSILRGTIHLAASGPRPCRDLCARWMRVRGAAMFDRAIFEWTAALESSGPRR
jgi:hypothetical protein